MTDLQKIALANLMLELNIYPFASGSNHITLHTQGTASKEEIAKFYPFSFEYVLEPETDDCDSQTYVTLTW